MADLFWGMSAEEISHLTVLLRKLVHGPHGLTVDETEDCEHLIRLLDERQGIDVEAENWSA